MPLGAAPHLHLADGPRDAREHRRREGVGPRVQQLQEPREGAVEVGLAAGPCRSHGRQHVCDQCRIALESDERSQGRSTAPRGLAQGCGGTALWGVEVQTCILVQSLLELLRSFDGEGHASHGVLRPELVGPGLQCTCELAQPRRLGTACVELPLQRDEVCDSVAHSLGTCQRGQAGHPRLRPAALPPCFQRRRGMGRDGRPPCPAGRRGGEGQGIGIVVGTGRRRCGDRRRGR
mmetsp:Transcript_107563/g.343151  ORF Transcript_107563/g.343151 Transcript_107563/m.343151 type:complete len:234 (-) Transcript_107563:1015-1716(-)